MKTIDNWFEENKQEFNAEEPDFGHFERFQNKLNASKKRKNVFSRSLMSIAAAVVVIMVSSVLLMSRFEKNSYTDLAEVSQECREVETYYSTKITGNLNKIEKLQCKNAKPAREILEQELNELDRNYMQLSKELAKNENDQRIIEAMINTMKTKAELIDFMLHKLQNNC